MKLSLAEAATVLGKSQRQLRYLIRSGQLPAAKEGGRWRIDSVDLPLTETQRQALAQRLGAAREAAEKAFAPVAKAVASGDGAKRRFSVLDLTAFQHGEGLYREAAAALGADEPACRRLSAALALVARGCHSFHPAEKARRFTEAREEAATAVAELLLTGEAGDEDRRTLARRIEEELIPKLSGLIAAHEKRGRRSRFDRFGSSLSPGG